MDHVRAPVALALFQHLQIVEGALTGHVVDTTGTAGSPHCDARPRSDPARVS